MKMYPVGNFSLKTRADTFARNYAVCPLDAPTGSSGAAGAVTDDVPSIHSAPPGGRGGSRDASFGLREFRPPP
jgi:hypothetical protein